MTDEMRRIRLAMAALEEQREVLGDHTIDAALAPLRERLAVLLGTNMHQEERRRVTVLCADLTGFEALLGATDSAEAHRIAANCLERITSTITRNRGTVEKQMVNEVLALFGAPVALEDPEETAVRAALSMQDALEAFNTELGQTQGRRLAMRIGISTGLVTVGSLAGEADRDPTAADPAVNVATRLRSTCRPGQVMISGETARGLHAVFDLEQPPQLIDVKGKQEPATAYVVEGERTRPGRVPGLKRLHAPMVGRDETLPALKASLERALVDRDWHVVPVFGKAGIGKTRLVHEFVGRVRQTFPQVRLLTGLSFAHTQATPYAPIADLVRDLFRIPPGADFATTVGQLTEGLRLLDPNTDEIEFLYRLGSLANVLGFPLPDDPLKPLEPEQRRDRIFLSLERLLLAAAADTPLLVILEDLHWSDALSLSFVERLASLAARGRTQESSAMLLVTSRPTEDPDSPLGHTLARLADLTQDTVELHCLDNDHTDALVKGLLGQAELPPRVLRLVRERTRGNPFYVEEVLRSFVEDETLVHDPDTGTWRLTRETHHIEVPATVQAVLAARLNRLPPDERRITQYAAVLGRTFWKDMLSEITVGGEDSPEDTELDETLSRLEERQLIVPEAESQAADDSEWWFRHGLIQEVAYASVTRAVQRRLHRHVAQWLEDCTPERTGSLVPMIAYHYERGDVPHKAIVYLRRAGEQAAAQLANNEAVKHLSRALELLGQVDHEPGWMLEQRYILLMEREKVYGLLGERDAQAADLVELTILANEMDDDHRRTDVALRHAAYHEAISDFSAARLSAHQAAYWAERTADIDQEIEGLIAWGRALWRQGAFADAKNRLEKALSLAQQSGNRSAEGTSLHNLGTVLYFLGDYREAQEHLERALAIRRALDDQRGEAVSLNNLAGIHHALGDFAQAKRLAERTLVIYQATGDRRNEIQAVSNLGTIHHALGGLVMARHYYQRALGLFQAVNDRRGEALATKNLGLVLHDLADYEDARHHCEMAVEIDRSTGDRVGMGYSLTYLAMALEGAGELDDANGLYQEALQLRRTIGQAALAIDDLTGLARVALATGDVKNAMNHTEEILDWIEGHGLGGVERPLKVYLTCADVLTAAGQTERASQILQAASDLLMERAARISDEASRQAFLTNVPLHRQMLERLAEADRS
jgi:predicted ATPase/class 3 adenylate cyclase